MIAGYLFIGPAFLTLVIFLVLPILAAFWLVFMDYDLLSPPKAAGLRNIQDLLSDTRLLDIYKNTAIFVVAATVLNNVIAILLALGVNRAFHPVFKYILRTAYFFPVLTTTASLALIWKFLLTQDRGVVNFLLQQINLPAVPWLSSSQWAMVSVVMFDVWRACGYLMVIYLAGLQTIPDVYYEAAAIDGATRLQSMRFITLPLLTPTTFFAVVISIIGAAQVFDNAWVLTGGGPNDASRLIMLYIYEIGFSRFAMGYAAAVSMTLFALLLLVTFLQFYLSRRWVHYE